MESLKNSFYVTLLSGDSLKFYPNNTLSKFTIQLPYTLNFLNNTNSEDDDWYVGLTRYVRPAINRNIRRIEFTSNALGKIYYSVLSILPFSPIVFEEIKNEYFFDVYDQNLNLPPLNETTQCAEVVEAINFYVKIPIMIQYTARELFDVIFTQIPKDKWGELKDYYRKVLHTQEIFLTTLRDEENDRLSSFITEVVPNYICFYTDIISPRIFGNKLSRALYMEPVLNIDHLDKRKSVDLMNVEYCRIDKQHVSSINILIADECGEQINFHDGTFNTLITLHFRKGI